METEAIPLRLQVFEEDNPELYAALKDLPKNKVKRRSALIHLLALGVRASRGSIEVVEPPANLPSGAESGAPSISPAFAAPAKAGAIPDVTIDADDLETFFSSAGS